MGRKQESIGGGKALAPGAAEEVGREGKKVMWGILGGRIAQGEEMNDL